MTTAPVVARTRDELAPARAALTDGDVAAKSRAAWDAGLTAIICVGETRADREGGRAIDVVAGQRRVPLVREQDPLAADLVAGGQRRT